VNQGGDQGHDDYGLPPVDIEIPDDARELDRDVQAYHRELRAQRRHERSMRWRAPFRRSGIAIPLLAGCLVAALVAVMVSAMFTANPNFTGTTGKQSSSQSSRAGSHSAGGSSSAAISSGGPTVSPSGNLSRPVTTPGAAVARLPGKTIDVAGKAIALDTLISTALAIVPARCPFRCTTAVSKLLAQAETAGVIVYLVFPRGASLAGLDRLVAATALRAKSTRVATDTSDALTSVYRPMGLTVLLVDAHGAVTVREGLGPKLMLERQLTSLLPTRQASPAGSPPTGP
jgi:hypothetical protein